MIEIVMIIQITSEIGSKVEFYCNDEFINIIERTSDLKIDLVIK